MKTLSILVLLLFNIFCGGAQQADVNAENGLALQGYDAVSYFHGGLLKGKPHFHALHMGTRYWFSNPANRELFMKDPLRYLPEYGGWCAYAMGENGEKVAVDPETYKIKDGRLYLFYNAFLNNTLKKWNAREEELLPKADIHWRELQKNKK